jgi:ABC-type proline/glycine betaine transport system substrate-binding protein
MPSDQLVTKGQAREGRTEESVNVRSERCNL